MYGMELGSPSVAGEISSEPTSQVLPHSVQYTTGTLIDGAENKIKIRANQNLSDTFRRSSNRGTWLTADPLYRRGFTL